MNETYTLTQRLTALEKARAVVEILRSRAETMIPAELPRCRARRREYLVRHLQDGFPALSHPMIGRLIRVEQSTVARIVARMRKAGRTT